jgi:hypothetical protein
VDLPGWFAKHVSPEPNSGCWLWTAYVTSKGYGVTAIAGRTARAHRVAWESVNGAIPEGMCVCHRCDNPGCVNPEHLFLGTTQENTSDRDQKGRQAKGSRNAMARLSPDIVRSIRQQAAEGVPVKRIARRLGLKSTTTRCVAKRTAWAWVSP